MSNQECKIRTEIINLNTNELMFYHYNIKINRCKGSCNTINDPYAKICAPDQNKNKNVKVFNLLSRTNETRRIKWHKNYKWKWRLDASICNEKQRWDDDKCRCECKELIDKRTCDKGFIWNPSNCECECDKSCDIGEYLDYENCRCRKKIIDKLVEECSENIDGNEMLYNETLDIISSNDNNKAFDSCIVYIILFCVFLIISISMAIYVYFVSFFFYQDFLSRTLTTHKTAGEGRGPFFIPLYHFHPLTNIQTFICNFACEMTITYF